MESAVDIPWLWPRHRECGSFARIWPPAPPAKRGIGQRTGPSERAVGPCTECEGRVVFGGAPDPHRNILATDARTGMMALRSVAHATGSPPTGSRSRVVVAGIAGESR